MFKKYYFTDFTEPETSDFEIPNSFLTFFDLEMNLQKSYGSLMVYYFSVSVKPLTVNKQIDEIPKDYRLTHQKLASALNSEQH